jgi:hypothetical protein
VIKTAAIIITVAFLSILYVNQHAGLLECSYSINNSNENLGLLIDHNSALRYNISKLESPLRLEDQIQQSMEAYANMPIDSYTVKVERPAIDVPYVHAGFPARVSNLVLSMFSLNTEAIAKELVD